MRHVLVFLVGLSVLAGSVTAYAASLDLQSAKITVFTNTLQSPVVGISLSASSIALGQPAHASALLNGATENAGGSLKYTVFSDTTCSTVFASSTKAVVNAAVPQSDDVTFTAMGTFYWQAAYSGDGNNQPAITGCTDHALAVSGVGQVQKTTEINETGTEVSASFATAPVPGHLLVAVVVTSTGNATITLDTPGWILAISNVGDPAVAIYYKVAEADEPAAHAVRTSGNGIAAVLSEYSGVDVNTPLGHTASGTVDTIVANNGGAFTCGAVTVGANERLIVAGAGASNGATSLNDAWDDSFIEQADEGAGNLRFAAAHRIVTEAGTYSTGSTLQGSSGNALVTCQTAAFNLTP